ncbi:MAG: polyprenyl synthetase family protein [Alloprevotella sp.]|nr:polyprenyl synthetase family protein [Alloprevotella sp.]
MSFLSHIETALGTLPFPTTPKGLYEPIRYALEMGGKRVRPVLTLLVYSLYRDDIERAVPSALAVEMYHNHTLLHDDLMDNAPLRRGRETVYRHWDANTAILSGDAMLIEAFRLVLQSDCERRAEMTALLADTALEVCEGQQYDMNFEHEAEVSVADYMEMIRLKTSVLLGCAAKMGALAANAPKADAEKLYAFGEKLGLAFQLQDDYLDCFGDPATFGKRIGGDIREGKKTFLLLTALNRADATTKTALQALIADKTMAEETKLASVLDIYRMLDIPTLTQQAIEALFTEAEALLAALPVASDKKQSLATFAQGLLKREK